MPPTREQVLATLHKELWFDFSEAPRPNGDRYVHVQIGWGPIILGLYLGWQLLRWCGRRLSSKR